MQRSLHIISFAGLLSTADYFTTIKDDSLNVMGKLKIIILPKHPTDALEKSITKYYIEAGILTHRDSNGQAQTNNE